MPNYGELGGPLSEKERLPDRAHHRLLEAIQTGNLPAGNRMSEVAISTEFGVSRSVVREALVRLEAEGFAERSRSGRWHVRRMDRKYAADVYECKAVIEGLSAALAAQRATPEQCSEIEQALTATADAYNAGRIEETALRSTGFHDQVLAAADNVKLFELDRLLRAQLIQNRILLLKHRARGPEFLEQNSQLLKSIMSGDAKAAEAIARGSALDDREGILKLFDLGVLP